MIFVCGADKDYDMWASQGNTGWDHNSLLPYFKKFESNTNNDTVQYKNGQYHGTSGPLTVSDYGSTDSLIPTLKNGFSQLGYKFIKDWNSKEYNGLVEVQATIKGGERMSAARAFLLPFKSRPNLTVMKGSMVEKVLFSGTKAIGVNIVTKNSDCLNIQVYARKEVILAAGTLGTPKILLKSGVGRPADLTPFSIPQVKNLAVGENFRDHVKTYQFIKLNPTVRKQNVGDVLIDATEYLFNRTGKFSNLNIMNYNAVINTTDPNATYPDIHYIMYKFEKSQQLMRDVLNRFSLKPEYVDQLVAINNDYQIIMVYNEVTNPLSKGTAKLRSNNVWDYPKVVTNYLDNPTDIDTMLRGYGKLEQLVATPAFQTLSAELIKLNITECDVFPSSSDDYRRCYIRYFSTSPWHMCGTTKMGPSSDPDAVVDARLKVHGLQGLRVADASIMPDVVTSNTQCPVYMIGEKAADMIKQDNP
jgi:choline dehydrogenase